MLSPCFTISALYKGSTVVTGCTVLTHTSSVFFNFLLSAAFADSGLIANDTLDDEDVYFYKQVRIAAFNFIFLLYIYLQYGSTEP